MSAAAIRPRVVLVDDHPQMLTATTSLLSGCCDVVAALPDGAAGADAVRRLQPDIVVLDIVMPRMHGLQVCESIRTAGAKTRIVFLSNHVSDDVVLDAFARGASGFVAKPRVALDLADAIGHVHAGRSFVPSTALLPRWSRRFGRHHLQPDTTDAAVVAGMTAFFDSALACGDALVAVVTPEHRRAVDCQLLSRGHDVRHLVETNRYQFIDAHAASDEVVGADIANRVRFADLLDARLDMAFDSVAGARSRVCVFNEMAAVLGAIGHFDAMLDLEEAISDYAVTRPVSMLCACSPAAYQQGGPGIVTRMCQAHSTFLPVSPRL